MGELAVIEPRAAVPVFGLEQVERIATAIARGGMFGSNDPNAVLTLCLLAQAEGRNPVEAFRDYHVISGKPAKKADAMLRDFLTSGGKVEWHRLDDDCADATFTHPAGGTARIAWDKARVAQAQLGNNPMHKKYPRQMLRSRVVSEGVRTVYPGATSGLYVPEEVADFDQPAAKPTPPAPKAQRARDMTPPVEIDGQSAARAKAEQWAAEHVAAINGAGDMATLDAVLKKGTSAREKLAANHADLADRVAVAISQARDALAGDDDFAAQIAQATTIVDVDAVLARAGDVLDAGELDALRITAAERIGEIEAGEG